MPTLSIAYPKHLTSTKRNACCLSSAFCFQTRDIKDKIAAPPSITLNQVATYRELDSDLQRHSTFTLLDNEIDLKVLAKHMSPESEVKETDVQWDWDGLFTDVSTNLKSQQRQATDISKQDHLI